MTLPSSCRYDVSKLFTPTTQATGVNQGCSGGSSGTSFNEAAPTDFPDRKVGRVVVTITGTIATDAESDGLGHSGNATARIEYKSTPGGAWATVPGATASSFANGVGGIDSDGPDTPSPWTFDLPVAIDNLDQIGIRAWGTCSTSGGTGQSDAVITITEWSVAANLKGGGILAA